MAKRSWAVVFVWLLALAVPTKSFIVLPSTCLRQTRLPHQQQQQQQQQHQQHQSPSRLKVVTEKGGGSRVRQEEEDETRFFFVRKCLPAEVGAAADILTDAFFKENTNLITYQWERLTTYLSLEGTYPKAGTRHAIFVACHARDGKVLGLAEIDDTPTKDRNATPRPYMFNVAVDEKWQRKGVAKALVMDCENIARAWNKPQVWLKVRETSTAAVAMYESLGYVTRSSRVERLNKKYQKLIVMSKDIDSGSSDMTVNDLVDY